MNKEANQETPVQLNLSLVPETSEIIRNKSEEWDFEKDGDPTSLIKGMSKIMLLNGGIGLAAPQVGISKRIFIMGTFGDITACINPKIILGTDKVREQEGCLSFPGLWLYVERYKTVGVQYQTITGEEKITTLTGLKAKVFQHELEHLDGICFDTKVGELALRRGREKQKKNSRK